MGKLRLGVIGAGSWAVASHLPNFVKRADDVEFVGVARKDVGLLNKIRDRYGFAVASEDYRDVIDAGIDIALVASPSGLRHEHARAALEAGAHVLVEKPVTIDPADAWNLVNLASSSDRHLLVAFGWNYQPMVVEAKRLMSEYGIGEVEQVTIHMASTTRELLSNTVPTRRPTLRPCRRARRGPTRHCLAAGTAKPSCPRVGPRAVAHGPARRGGVRLHERPARRPGRTP